MKKYIIVLFLTVFIVPSIAFASWWNPFSWKIFNHKTEVSVVAPIPEPVIDNTSANNAEEVQKPKQQPEIIATPKKINKEIKTVTPVINNSEIIKKQVQEQIEITLKAKAEQDALIAKQKSEEQTISKTHQVLQSLYGQLSNISSSMSLEGDKYFALASQQGYTTTAAITLKESSDAFEQNYIDAQNLQTNFINIPANYSQAIQNAIKGAQCERDLTYMLMTDIANNEPPTNANIYLADCAGYRAYLIAFLETTTP